MSDTMKALMDVAVVLDGALLVLAILAVSLWLVNDRLVERSRATAVDDVPPELRMRAGELHRAAEALAARNVRLYDAARAIARASIAATGLTLIAALI